VSVPDVHAVLERLRLDDHPRRYFYRGQTTRYPAHVWMIGANERCIEALYPNDFRFMSRFATPTIEFDGHLQIARVYGRSTLNHL